MRKGVAVVVVRSERETLAHQHYGLASLGSSLFTFPSPSQHCDCTFLHPPPPLICNTLHLYDYFFTRLVPVDPERCDCDSASRQPFRLKPRAAKAPRRLTGCSHDLPFAPPSPLSPCLRIREQQRCLAQPQAPPMARS